MVGIKYIKNGVEGRKIHRVKQIIGFSRGFGILDSGNGFNELLAFVLPFALIDRAGAEECNKVFFKAVEMRVEHLFIGIGADAHFFVSYNACQLVDTAVFGKEGVELGIQCPGSAHFVEADGAFIVSGRVDDDHKKIVVGELLLDFVYDVLRRLDSVAGYRAAEDLVSIGADDEIGIAN